MKLRVHYVRRLRQVLANEPSLSLFVTATIKLGPRHQAAGRNLSKDCTPEITYEVRQPPFDSFAYLPADGMLCHSRPFPCGIRRRSHRPNSCSAHISCSSGRVQSGPLDVGFTGAPAQQNASIRKDRINWLSSIYSIRTCFQIEDSHPLFADMNFLQRLQDAFAGISVFGGRVIPEQKKGLRELRQRQSHGNDLRR